MVAEWFQNNFMFFLRLECKYLVLVSVIILRFDFYFSIMKHKQKMDCLKDFHSKYE